MVPVLETAGKAFKGFRTPNPQIILRKAKMKNNRLKAAKTILKKQMNKCVFLSEVSLRSPKANSSDLFGQYSDVISFFFDDMYKELETVINIINRKE